MRTWSYGFCAWRLLPPVPTVSFVRSEIVRMTCRTKWGASGSCHLCGPWPFKWLKSLEVFSWWHSEGFDWARRKMVCLKVCPKGLIVREGRWFVWSPSESLSEGFDWTRQKMVRLKSVRKSVQMIWLDETEDGPSEVCPKESDWTRRKMLRLKSVRRNLIGQDGRWSVWSPSEGIWLGEKGIWSLWRCVRLVCPARMIWLDETKSGLIFWDRLWLAGPMDLSSGNASDWLIRWICLQASSFDFFLVLVLQFHTAIRD